MSRILLACISLAFVCGALAADDKGDPIRARLEEARATYEADTERAKSDLAAQLDFKMDAAQKSGDLLLVRKLRAEREGFAQTDEAPKSVSLIGYKAARKRSAERLSAAFTQARKEYTQAGKIAEAEAVDAELTEFARTGRVRPAAAPAPAPKLGRVAPAPLRVVSAVWGTGSRNADVTELVGTLIAQGKPVLVDGPVLGADPAPNQTKTLRLKVQVGDQVLEMTIPDRGVVRLSPAK